MNKFLKDNLLLILILSVGAFLRVWRLGEYSLWKDEIFSMLEAQRSLGEIFTTKTYFFGYAPIHHFFVHLALYFGKSEFVVRFPSVIFGVATIYLIYKLGALFFNKRVGLVSAFLLAISTLHLEYSREVRYYSYLIFFSGLTIFFLYKLVTEKRWRWLVLYSVVTVLNMATQATAVLVLISQMVFLGLWFFLKRRKKDFRFTPKLIFVIPFVIAAGIFVKSFNELFSSIKFKPAMPPFEFLAYTFTNLSGEKIVVFFYLILFILGLIFSLKNKKKEALSLGLLFILPLLILYLVRPQVFDFHSRYVSFIVIPYLLLVSYGIVRLLKHNTAILVAVFASALLSIQPISAYYQTKKGDWQGVGQYLVKNTKSGDAVITESYYNKILLDYYLEAPKRGLILKTAAESLVSIKVPFRIFFHQHDYSAGYKANPEGLPLINYEKIIPFDPEAQVSPMYLFVSQPIYFWQEGEGEWIKNQGWYISELWGQKTIAADSLNFPDAQIIYKLNLPQDGSYDLYVNLRWDGGRGVLKYKLDGGSWSEGFQPFYGEKGDVISKWRMKEKKLGTLYLKAGDHQITFLNQKADDPGDRYQTIDYFYLTKKE